MRYISLFSGIEAASVAWAPLGWEPVCFCEIDAFPTEGVAFTVAATQDQTLFQERTASDYIVRRLTPMECERLQGFPDDWTKVPFRGKPAEECPDTPRYKACGNSMAVPVMRWIGERIQMVDSMLGGR